MAAKISIDKAMDNFMEWQEVIGKSNRTIDNVYYEVNRMVADTKVKSLHKIDEYVINSWINSTGQGITAGTRRFKLSCIKMFLSYCVAKGYIQTNPALLVKVNLRNVKHAQRESKKKLSFDEAEYKYLMKNIESPFWKAAFSIGVETGLRLGDILQLEWDCIGKQNITVWTDKRDKRVSIKMSAALRQAIAKLPHSDPDYLFPVQRKEYLEEGKRSHFSVYFKRLLKRHGIKDKSFHCTRVTFATWAEKKGGKMADIAKDLGHSSEKTTRQHYIHK